MQLSIVTHYDFRDVVGDIERLVNLLGRGKIIDALNSWRKSLKTSHGFLLLYYRYPFYWWPAFHDFFENKNQLQSNPRLLMAPKFNQILMLGQDAKRILTLWPDMPESVRKKYLGTLVKREKAPAHVFEIERAWDFHKQGMRIVWHEDDLKPGPEFIAIDGHVEIEVECKEFQIHTGKRVAKEYFCRLGNEINDHLRSKKLMGEVSIQLDGSLPTQYVGIKAISDEVACHLKKGLRRGEVAISSGRLFVDLLPNDDIPIDYTKRFNDFVSSKPSQMSVGFLASKKEGEYYNPFGFALMSTMADNSANLFYDTLRHATERQLSKTRPAVLCAYIPYVVDVTLLAKSDIANLADRLFADPARSHLAIFIVSSIHKREIGQETVTHVHDALVFKNPNCRFSEIASVPYLNPPKE